jgi:hypothetical protein
VWQKRLLDLRRHLQLLLHLSQQDPVHVVQATLTCDLAILHDIQKDAGCAKWSPELLCSKKPTHVRPRPGEYLRDFVAHHDEFFSFKPQIRDTREYVSKARFNGGPTSYYTEDRTLDNAVLCVHGHERIDIPRTVGFLTELEQLVNLLASHGQGLPSVVVRSIVEAARRTS